MPDPQTQNDALAEKVELAIGGTLYAGWTSVSVTRSLDALSGQFALELAHKATAEAPEFEIRAGDRCELRIGGETVINGWVDAVQPRIAGEDHIITVSGRDRTGDLADCSAIHKPGSWRNTRVETIAAALVKPFGISVSAKASTGKPIARFALQQGETVNSALERLMRFRGLLMVANAKGDLEIITPDEGAPVATLELGVNIKSASGNHDARERFSEYRVKGQASGNDHHHGKPVAQIRGLAKDPGVTRYRPLLVIAEDQSDTASATTRAKWEAGVRAGKAISCEIVTIGWRTAPGAAIWRPNTRVKVKCAAVQLADETMLVTAVTLTKSEGGTEAAVTVMPPGAWKQLAEPEKLPKKKKGHRK